jgi:hypothetical protein
MDPSDKALLLAFLLAAGLGTWTRCLMHDDGREPTQLLLIGPVRRP